MADASGDPELRWVTREIFEFDLSQVGELDAALRMSDEQLELSRTDPTLGIAMVGISTANSFSHRALILVDLGRFDEADDAFGRFDQMARRFNENETIAWNDTFRSRLAELRGDVQSALSMARRAVEGAERIGSLLARGLSHGCYGAALGQNAEWEAAVQSIEFGLEISRANRVGLFFEGYFMAALAEAHLGLGEAPRARALADEAIGIASRMQIPIAEVRALLARTRVLLTLDGVNARAEIESTLDRALALVRSTGARPYEPQIYVERARLAGILSDAASHQQWLREAHRLFTEMGATGHAERIAPLLAASLR